MSRSAKTVLLALSSLFLAASCVNVDNTLGASYIPLDRNIYILTEDFDVPVGMRYADSVNTELLDRMPIGSISSPDFGNVTVGSAVSIVPTCAFRNWGTDPVFKSMVLTLVTSSIQTLDDNQTYIPENIYVHRMKCDLDSTKIYNGTITEDDYEAGQCCIGVNFSTGLDTVFIKFPEEFARPIMNMDSVMLDSVELFCKNFKGLYFRTDRRDSNDYGGRISEFDVSSYCLSLNYTSTDENGRRRDTAEVFGLASPMAYSVMTVCSDRKISECEDAREAIICEGLTGVTPFISGRKMRDAFDKWMAGMGINKNNIMISKAQFEFPVYYCGNSSYYRNYPANLFPSRRLRDSTGNVIYTPIGEINTAEYSTGLLLKTIDDGKDAYYYRPDAALFIQSLIKEDYDKVDNTYDIWLLPTASYSITTNANKGKQTAMNQFYTEYYYQAYGVDLSSTTQTFYCSDYMTYFQGSLNGTAAGLHPTLKITYTVTAE